MQDQISPPALAAEHRAIGRAVRQLRARHGLSQEALGVMAGLHRTHVSAVERGRRRVSFAVLVRLAWALEVSLSELVAVYEQRLADGV